MQQAYVLYLPKMNKSVTHIQLNFEGVFVKVRVFKMLLKIVYLETLSPRLKKVYSGVKPGSH